MWEWVLGWWVAAGLGRGGLWWHGGFGCGGAVMAWGSSCGWVPMGLGWIFGMGLILGGF